MKTLGVIGGLGPMATAYFLQLLTLMSDAASDQEHMEIVMYSRPSIPDRTKYILGESGENPVPDMIRVGKKLKEMGADLLAVPCITAHYFHQELEDQIGLPIIHAVKETVTCLEQEAVTQAGILATDGTIKSGLFQEALSRQGIKGILPEKNGQKKVMEIIYQQVKAGKEVDMTAFGQLSEELFDRGAQVILLACTELSLIKRDHELAAGYLDVMEVLARKAVCSCNRVQERYRQLIGK